MTRSKGPRVTTPPTTAQEHEPSALRHRLVDQLLAAGHVRTTTVEAALRSVPRHAFAPEVPVQTAYADDITPTRHTPDGRISSSISAPWLQAVMLESARLRSGHHVLEVGSGGYNAALIAELVGRTGQVTTVDIDPDVTDRATRFLCATGYDRVRVLTADAEHLPPRGHPRRRLRCGDRHSRHLGSAVDHHGCGGRTPRRPAAPPPVRVVHRFHQTRRCARQ
ncbi:class I SAM-dependent methyltransferase [Streptomyces sp. NPDC058145]|uniref:class I SAM-dependent methyltransferase n=1 Tax=Streptomyces sp. NPDC058145 TaxID=3346356 RepID=UPI0036E9B344